MANFNSESYLRRNSPFYPIIKSNCKKELHFFFNHELHQIKNTVQVPKPLSLQKNAIPIGKLCNTWVWISGWLSRQWCIRLFTVGERGKFNRLFYPNNWRWKWIEHFFDRTVSSTAYWTLWLLCNAWRGIRFNDR